MIIPYHSNYDISEDGVVTNLKTNKEVKRSLAKCANNTTYYRVSITSDFGVTRVHSVLKLMADTYLVKPNKGAVAHAKDGNNLNVNLSNVEFITRSEFAKQRWKDGKYSKRKARPKCWSQDSMDFIFSAIEELGPISLSDLNAALPVPYSTIRYSVDALIEQNRVVKTKSGLEVIPI